MDYDRQSRIRGMVLILLVGCMFFAACSNNAPEVSAPTMEESTQQTTAAPDTVQTVEPLTQVQTKYLVLSYSDKYEGVVQHREMSSETITMEIFSMCVSDTERELFRIYFGGGAEGIANGYLTVEEEEIPITYTICQYSDEEFPDEETRSIYLETMNCFNDVMNSIQADERFNMEKAEAPIDRRDAAVAYWTFSLPETMEYEEERSEQYKLHFFGNVAGERISLYTVILGEPCGKTVIGAYEVDGNKQLLSVESYVLEPKEHWSEEDTKSAYIMMGTVNDVLQTIMSSEHFSEEIPQ